MSTPLELARAVQVVAEAVRATAEDPLAQIAALVPLAAPLPVDEAASDTVSTAVVSIQAAISALTRRAALAAMARAAAVAEPASYDEAVALRDLVCGLLDAGIIEAGDRGDDASSAAMRALKNAVGTSITRRAANLARLREIHANGPLPAIVHAYRLYADVGRKDEVAAYAGAADPNLMPSDFRVRSA